MSETSVVAMLPGKYRVHFESNARDGAFYMDIEVKRGKPRAFVRGTGPHSSPEAIAKFSKRQVYLDTLYPGCRPQFHGPYVSMIHTIDRVERLST